MFRTIPWKRKQLGIPFRGTKIEINSRNSRSEVDSDENIVFAGAGFFYKTNFFSCHFLLFRASELTLPETSECLGMSTFFRGITETILSLFRGIFSERYSAANLVYQGLESAKDFYKRFFVSGNGINTVICKSIKRYFTI